MEKQIPFRIIGLQVENFRLTENKPKVDQPVEIRTDYEFGVIPSAHLVSAKLTYTYHQNGNVLLEMTLVSTFDVEPAAFQSMIADGIFTLEPYFSQYLSTINVGAARGEIHARSEQAGSMMANFILPPINLVEALPAPITIALR